MSTYSRGFDVVRVAVVGIAGVVAFGALFLYVTNRSLAHGRTDIIIQMPIAVGLAKGDPVRFRGVDVGEVRHISFGAQSGVLVSVRLVQDVPLTTDARAEMVPVDLFGRQSLVLLAGDRTAPPLATHDTISGLQPASMSERIDGIGVQAEKVLNDSMIMLLQETLTGSGVATREIAQMSSTMTLLLAAQHDNVTRLTNAAAGAADNVAAATAPEELDKIRGSFARSSARMDSATVAIADMLSKLEGGQGTAGRLLNDSALHDRTEALLVSLDQLARDVKTNPKRYINVKIF